MDEAERLLRLEERYAHLQRHVTQQDKAMLELSDQLARLRVEFEALRTRATGGTDGAEPADERPPHY